MIDFENTELIDKALKNLTESNRNLIDLYFYQQLSIEEISIILNLSSKNIKLKLKNAIENIKNILKRLEYV